MHKTRVRKRVHFTILSLLALSTIAGPALSQSDGEERKQQREKLLKQMRTRAERIKAVSLAEKRRAAAMIPKPLFRYDDQPRQILDATLWGWGEKGRPLALCKIEKYRDRNEGAFVWCYCMASLSTAAIEMDADDDHRWIQKKPGIVIKPLEVDSEPPESPVARLRRMKGIASEFSASMWDTGGREQLRLLPRPLYRYTDEENGITDGAIFTFASFGTNPTILLIIEARTTGDSAPAWRYAITAMTAAPIQVTRDGKTIWSAPVSQALGMGSPNPWAYFYVRTTQADERTENKGD